MATYSIVTKATKPYDDQKPGTSGLRKKVKVFEQENYLKNFVQATFNALAEGEGIPKVLVVGGDGRYWSPVACQQVLNLAAANGVETVIVGEATLLSTPAVSALIRTHSDKPQGGFILTASHNPGGPQNDFGIKYNGANGGPAPEKLTNVIHQKTLTISEFPWVENLPETDLNTVGTAQYTTSRGQFTVKVVSSVENYLNRLSSVFDFEALKKLIGRKEFTMVYDGMHGVAGPYAKAVFVDLLGAPESCTVNCVPSPSFNDGHPDPNLTYATDLVLKMGLKPDGSINPEAADVPAFGAAADGDADRNMILGNRFFVTPSDSLAVICANAKDSIPFFKDGLKAVARSMPTSGAVDRVANALGIRLFEVPTGWKFFGNLMDSAPIFGQEDFTPLICGEESFGTGSDHVREKDGVWAVLAWLSILQHKNADPSAPFVSVEQIVVDHWKKYGRNYYCRYDYEEVDSAAANKLMEGLRNASADSIPTLNGQRVATLDDFKYVDPVDGSVSEKQGIRCVYPDGSRFVFRLSGTGASGATIRLYIEKFMDKDQVASASTLPTPAEYLGDLVQIALNVSNLQALTGRDKPTVIT